MTDSITLVEMRRRIETLESQDVVSMLIRDTPPTTVSSYVGMFYLDKVAKKRYVCFGGTDWGVII